jgi:hypothetical protein
MRSEPPAVKKNELEGLQPMPPQAIKLELSREFSPEEMRQIKAGYRPDHLDDNWFAYFEDGRLHLHRSDSGYEIFQLELSEDEKGGRIKQCLVNHAPEQYRGSDPNVQRGMVLGLIESLFINKPR